MTLHLTDIRCHKCGRKLADEVSMKGQGFVVWTCPRCKEVVRLEVGPAPKAATTE